MRLARLRSPPDTRAIERRKRTRTILVLCVPWDSSVTDKVQMDLPDASGRTVKQGRRAKTAPEQRASSSLQRRLLQKKLPLRKLLQKRLLQGKMLLPRAQALGDARKNYFARRNSRQIPEKSDVPSRPRPPGEEGGAPSALLKNRKRKGK